jgi:prepilin-type N-terminal cleavage/methylation domain-containing protein
MSERGFTVLELVIVVAIGLIMAAIAVPMVQSAINIFTVRAAASAATSGIQSTRYQAIFHGCSYEVAFSKANSTYQVLGKIADSNGNCAAAFSNVGGAIPLSGRPIALAQDTTLLFRPNGMTQATVGAMTMTVSYLGQSKTIMVSTYGNTTITP